MSGIPLRVQLEVSTSGRMLSIQNEGDARITRVFVAIGDEATRTDWSHHLSVRHWWGLEAGESIEIPVSRGAPPAFEVTVHWVDADGMRQQHTRAVPERR